MATRSIRFGRDEQKEAGRDQPSTSTGGGELDGEYHDAEGLDNPPRIRVPEKTHRQAGAHLDGLGVRPALLRWRSRRGALVVRWVV